MKQHLPAHPKSFSCCHIKTGTLIYGVIVGISYLFVFGLLVLFAVHPDVLMPKEHSDGIFVIQTNNGYYEKFEDQPAVNHNINRDNLCVMFGITLVGFISTIALIYGVARNMASYLMPFFCLQVFDFCLSCLTVAGMFVYVPNMKEWVRAQGLENLPVMDRLMCLDRDLFMLLVVSVLILMLGVKAYLIRMVWSCYKYIQLYAASRSVLREYSVDPDTQMLMPPRYEDAIKMSGPQPPAYSSD